jgi:hypothetical protein
VKLAALALNATAEAPVRLAPLIVTMVPTGPLDGAKLVIAGGGMTVKLVALVAVPPAVVTLTGPVVAPAGTVAWMVLSDVTVKLAAVPLNVTALVVVKLVPLIVTPDPTAPVVGAMLVIVGGRPFKNTFKMFAVVR